MQKTRNEKLKQEIIKDMLEIKRLQEDIVKKEKEVLIKLTKLKEQKTNM